MPHAQMIEERLKFLGIDHNVRMRLRDAKTIVEPELDRMLERFYSHILGKPELKALFVDEESIHRARSAQREHWSNTLFGGNYGNEYFEKAERIGHAHARVGLTQNWYIGAYCYMLVQFIELISEKAPDSVTPLIQSLCKAIFLDLDLVIHCYLDTKDSAMRQILRRATDFAADISALNDDLDTTATKIEAAADLLLAEAASCAAQSAQITDDLKLAERQLNSIATGSGSESGEPPLLDRLETASSGDATLSEQAKNTLKGTEELIGEIERLRSQTQQLRERLDELQFRDRLYIDDSGSDSGTFARLKALLWKKS
jgi:hypothetical protein